VSITTRVIDAKFDKPTFIAGRATVTELVDEAVHLAHHDMPAELFNEIAGLLINHPNGASLYTLEKLRNRYGASTRRALGLDE
jgi:hypothetical protein